MIIRWAKDNDALHVQSLLLDSGIVLENADWTGIGRTWLLVESNDKPVACLAYHPGRPLARLDFLCVAKNLENLSKGRVVRSILDAAFAVCALHGSSFVSGVIPYDMPEWGDVVVRRGGKVVNEGWMYIGPVSGVVERRNEIDGRRKINNDDDSHKNA